MKKILFLLLLIGSVVSAQYSPTGSKTRFVNGIGLSSKDTTGWTSADTLVIIMGLDSVPYYRYKGYWKPLKGGSGGSVTWNDITGKPSNFPTTFALSNDIPDSIRLRLFISDTATMLLPYARVSDIDNKLLLKVNYGDTAAMLYAYKEKDISHDASINSLNEDTATLVERFSNQTNLANSKLSGITAISPLSSTDGTNPIISIPLATNSTNGYLSASDRTAFNNKQAALGFTPENIANKNVANGYAGLDANSKIPLDLLSNTVLAYKGLWNANTNTPTLSDGTGTAGWVYVVSVGGTRNLGSGNITFNVGDYVLYNGSIWQANTGGNQVVSVAVNGSTPQQGIVNITLPNSSVTNSQLLNNSVTIGSTTTALGGTSTSLNGLTSVSATNLSGGGTGLTSLPTNTGLYPTLPYLSTNGGNVSGAVNITGKLTLTDSLKGASIKLSSGADNKLLASSGVQLTVGSGLNITGNVISGTSGSNVVGQSPISVNNGVVSIGTPVPTSLGGTGSSIATNGLSNLKGMQQVASSSTAVVLTNTSPSEIQVTGTIAQNINLPDPSTLVIGYVLKVYNISSQTVTVRPFGGSPSIATIATNTLSEFTLINTSFTGTAAWRSRVVGFAFTTGTGAVVRATSPTLSSPNIVSPTVTGGTLTSSTLVLPTISSITVSGGVATMPTGNGTLAYTAQLDNYKLKSDTGFVGGYTTRERTKQLTDSVASRINDLANAVFIDNINAIPKWAGLSYIESNITDNGSKITLGGTALALPSIASSNSKIPIVLSNGDVSSLDTGRTTTALITGGIAKRITDSLGAAKQNFNANTTTLGNATTGTGSIVRASAPTLTSANLQLPKISSIEVPDGNYISLPQASGTMALTSDLAPYKLKSDSLFNEGYTTRGRTKQQVDSIAMALALANSWYNVADTTKSYKKFVSIGAYGNYNLFPGTYPELPHYLSVASDDGSGGQGNSLGLSHYSSAGGGPAIHLSQGRGTILNPTQTQAGDALGSFGWRGQSTTRRTGSIVAFYPIAEVNATDSFTATSFRLEVNGLGNNMYTGRNMKYMFRYDGYFKAPVGLKQSVYSNGLAKFNSDSAIIQADDSQVGAFSSTPVAKGLDITSGVLRLHSADTLNAGGIDTLQQYIRGVKNFSTSAAAGTNAVVRFNRSAGAATSGAAISLGINGNYNRFINWGTNASTNAFGRELQLHNQDGNIRFKPYVITFGTDSVIADAYFKVNGYWAGYQSNVGGLFTNRSFVDVGYFDSARYKLTTDLTWTNNSGFGLKGSDGVRYLAYSTAGGVEFGYQAAVSKIYHNTTLALTTVSGGSINIAALGTGTVQATAGTLSIISDGRLKNKLGYFNNATDAIMKLAKPQYWKYSAKSKLPKEAQQVRQFGLMADDVHKVLGEQFAPTQKDGYYGLSDRALLGLAIQAIQELKAEIEQLKKK